MSKRRQHISLDDDHPNEECGIFGIYSPEVEVARKIFFALYALQHRGQEGAGITTVNQHGRMSSHRGMGLVMQIFTESEIKRLTGRLGIGHARYSTAGGSNIHNAQPFVVETKYGAVSIAHNGQLTLANKLRDKLMKKGVGMFTTNDSEIVAQMLAATPENLQDGKPHWEVRLSNFMNEVEGAYSICVLVKDALFGIRDRLGMRPLCIGEIKGNNGKNTYVLSSESCALTTIGATLVRDVFPGEIVRIDENGLSSSWGLPPTKLRKSAFCVFEYVYFARPDSLINGVLVHSARQQLGRQLAREKPCPVGDVVIGVPDSSTPMAIGFSQESGIPFTEGLCKNRYIGRTFIQPTSDMRITMVQLKYNPLSQNLFGRNVILVDDSLVRGHTVSQLIGLIRSAGAKTVHVRIASPPLCHPCKMGIDMKTKEELIAGFKTVEEIQQLIGADSLAYLSHEGMIKAILSELPQTGIEPNKELEIVETVDLEPNVMDNKEIKVSENTKIPEMEKKEPEKTEKFEKKDPEIEKKEVEKIKVEKKEPEIEKSKTENLEKKVVEKAEKIEPEKSKTGNFEKKDPKIENPEIGKKEQQVVSSDTVEENQSASGKSTMSENTKKEDNSPDKKRLVESVSHSFSFCSACFTGVYPLDIEDIHYACGLDL